MQVSGTRASPGGTAVLTCNVPPAVKDHVAVSAWYRDDSMLLPGPPDEGKKLYKISCKTTDRAENPVTMNSEVTSSYPGEGNIALSKLKRFILREKN